MNEKLFFALFSLLLCSSCGKNKEPISVTQNYSDFNIEDDYEPREKPSKDEMYLLRIKLTRKINHI